MPKNMPMYSYIWNLKNPNFPEKTISPPSPLCTLQFNHKNSDILVGGSYNGSLSFYDLRRGDSKGVITPFATSILEKSHHDPVYDVHWITTGKLGSECVSTSSDGRVLWWDYRNLDAGPIDELVMNESFPQGEDKVDKILGGTRLEYNAEAGPLKILIGTE
jgi:dynein intermediate chain 2